MSSHLQLRKTKFQEKENEDSDGDLLAWARNQKELLFLVTGD